MSASSPVSDVAADVAVRRAVVRRLHADPPSNAGGGRAELRVHLAGLLRAEAPLVDSDRADRLLDELVHEVDGLGPLDALLVDPDVTEIMVNGPGRAYVERAGRLVAVDLGLDAAAIARLAERIVAPLGLRLDRSSPIVDARLTDGSRVHAVLPPLAPDGPCLTIRRFAARPVTLADVRSRARPVDRSCGRPCAAGGTCSWPGRPARARPRC